MPTPVLAPKMAKVGVERGTEEAVAEEWRRRRAWWRKRRPSMAAEVGVLDGVEEVWAWAVGGGARLKLRLYKKRAESAPSEIRFRQFGAVVYRRRKQAGGFFVLSAHPAVGVGAVYAEHS